MILLKLINQLIDNIQNLGLVGLCVADQVGAEAARPESPWTAVGVLIVSGLVLALLNLCCQVSREMRLVYIISLDCNRVIVTHYLAG